MLLNVLPPTRNPKLHQLGEPIEQKYGALRVIATIAIWAGWLVLIAGGFTAALIVGTTGLNDTLGGRHSRDQNPKGVGSPRLAAVIYHGQNVPGSAPSFNDIKPDLPLLRLRQQPL